MPMFLALAVMNLAGFAAMAIDKSAARRGAERIPERVLFLFAIAGGSLGCNLGMFLCRHKTKHWYFRIGLPAILILQLAVTAYMYVVGVSFTIFD